MFHLTRPIFCNASLPVAIEPALSRLGGLGNDSRFGWALPVAWMPARQLSRLGRAFFLSTFMTACAAPQIAKPTAVPTEEIEPTADANEEEQLREQVKHIVEKTGFFSDEKEKTVNVLVQMGPKIVPILRELYYEHWFVEYKKEVVVRALARLPVQDGQKDRIYQVYLDALGIPDHDVKMAGVEGLGNLRDPRAAEHLLPFLDNLHLAMEDITMEPAGIAITILSIHIIVGQILVTGDPSVSIKKYPNWNREAEACAALIKLGKGAIPVVLNSFDGNMAKTAAKIVILEGLGYSGPELTNAKNELKGLNDEAAYGWASFRSQVASKLSDPESKARVLMPNLDLSQIRFGFTEDKQEHTVQALAALGSPALPHLIKAVETGSNTMAGHAAWALGMIRDDRAYETLVAAMASKSFYVRLYAARALGDFGDKKSEAILTKALKDKDSFVRKEAREALEKLKKSQIANP